DLGLTGAKFGCGEGSCGACSVLVDGAVTHACVTPAEEAGGRVVTTVEGLAENGRLSAVQQAFVDADALQCGYCTPGMVIAATALIARESDPDDATIRADMEANICRCGTYARIVRGMREGAGNARLSTPAAPPSTANLRPRAPWDLCEVADRDYNEV